MKPPPSPPEFCSVVDGRRPHQKLHKTLGHAKNALTCEWARGVAYDTARHARPVRGGRIFRWDAEAGEWALVYDVPFGTYTADLPWRT